MGGGLAAAGELVGGRGGRAPFWGQILLAQTLAILLLRK